MKGMEEENRKKRILHVLSSSSYSGAENVAITIIKVMKDKYNFCYTSSEGKIREVLSNQGIYYLPVSKMSISEIKRVVKKYNPDLIHAHDFRASIICSIFGNEIPIISHIHHYGNWMSKHGFYSLAYLISSARYCKIIAVSKTIKDKYIYKSLLTEKMKVISNPINISEIREKSIEYDLEKKYDIIYLGRLANEKDPTRFISLMERVVQIYPDIHIALIGEGYLYDECLTLIQKLNLSSNIELLGFIKNPYPILKKSKILCITSKTEGYGLVAVEALALGLPVVASDVGGLREIIDDMSGKLCESDNDFVSEIDKLLKDNLYYLKKSKLALKRAEELHNIEHYIENLDELYRGKER